MSHRFIIFGAMLAPVLLSAATASPALKIFNDDEHTDTVFSSKYYVVAVTEAGNSAYVNGEEVHVYKTGSFGAEVALKPGNNKISVEVKKGKKTSKAQVDIFYSDVKRPSRPAPVTVQLASPKNIVTAPGAYLQFGNGADRLGGSKMGYIDEGIGMTAVGETDNLYKVMLGESRYAYLPKEYAIDGGNGFTTVNSGSWSISNKGNADRISVALPMRLAYYTRSEIDPSVIKVSLYGATNNSNWITQQTLDLGMVDFVDFEQEESDVLTVIIRLKEKYAWGYSVNYEGNNLVIDVRHRPESLKLSDLTIGLDAGHGGQYLGAVSPSGLTEKEVNLDIVLAAAEMLRSRGAKVVLTRDGDTGPSMTERKRIWKENNVDLAVSVHNNASGSPLVPMGSSTYYKHISNRPLAAELLKEQLSLGHANFGLTGNFNFSLNGPTDYPNALIEVLFMSSLPDEELLADPAYRRRIAEKIVSGLENYLKAVERSL